MRKGGGLEEGGASGGDSGKHASSVIEGGYRLKPKTNVVRMGGGLEEGGAKNRDLQATAVQFSGDFS